MFCGIGVGRLWVRPGEGFLVTPWHSTEAVLGPSPHPHPLPLLPKNIWKELGHTLSNLPPPWERVASSSICHGSGGWISDMPVPPPPHPHPAAPCTFPVTMLNTLGCNDYFPVLSQICEQLEGRTVAALLSAAAAV